MKFQMLPKEGRILKLSKEEKVCVECGRIGERTWYFCEVTATLLCAKCNNKMGSSYTPQWSCARYKDHIHYMIDKLVIEE